MWSKAMTIRCFKSLNRTESISNKSVNIQRDIISTFTPAVSISCLDFASLILVETSVDEKILLLAKFRCFTTDPEMALTHPLTLSLPWSLTKKVWLQTGNGVLSFHSKLVLWKISSLLWQFSNLQPFFQLMIMVKRSKDGLGAFPN